MTLTREKYIFLKIYPTLTLIINLLAMYISHPLSQGKKHYYIHSMYWSLLLGQLIIQARMKFVTLIYLGNYG